MNVSNRPKSNSLWLLSLTSIVGACSGPSRAPSTGPVNDGSGGSPSAAAGRPETATGGNTSAGGLGGSLTVGVSGASAGGAGGSMAAGAGRAMTGGAAGALSAGAGGAATGGANTAARGGAGGATAGASGHAPGTGGAIGGNSSAAGRGGAGAGSGGGSSGSSGSTGTTTGPCDLYATGGTPCVAAFSTTRALFGNYVGHLYQVRRADGMTHDIDPVTKGGSADSAAQDTFCSGSTCTISILYDQSGKGNDLTKAPGGSATYGPNADIEAVADALPIQLGGHKVYGLHVTGASSYTDPHQTGYRNTKTSGIAKGDNPETEYMVTDGSYTNGNCCFDFGNAEMQPVAGGYGTMEAIYFGSCNWWDKGAGNGPWVMADLEVGVYSMGGPNAYSDANKNGTKSNTSDPSFTNPFVTAMLKGNSSKATNGGPFTLKGGNAQSGTLQTIWDGASPVGYSPMNRQGGIVLGIGGDNSSTAHGNFYEGVMTTGYASTATDDAVQANIVAAGYAK